MLGKRLQAVRKKLQLSQEEISSQIGISYRAYTSYERGDRNPSIDFLQSLVTKFNINLNWLIAEQGEMFITPQFDASKDVLRQQVLDILKDEGLIK